ncbi:MAG: adenine phosphoribosyltransferase [alpha proteobacterium HIMB59]|nr:MAG: adenine phosphoribosyltransferase [alpha proteobacterium HIMB59]
MSQTLKSIRIIKDFPKKGISFYDISTILSNPSKFYMVVNKMSKEVQKINADTIVGIDSRGFIFASAVAYKLKKKLVMIRKKGKLPGKTFSIKYNLEYGSSQLEMQKDMIIKKDKVVIIDDIFATSGTMKASINLIKRSKASIKGIIVLLELSFLNGRSKIKENLISLEKVNI